MIVSPEEALSILATDQIAFTEACFNTVSPGDDYSDNWHVHCIVEHLRAVERGEIKRLIVNMPPRSMKSISISIAWPAWLLGQSASNQIIVASYGQELSTEMSVNTRLIIESDWYKSVFPDTVIASDQNQKHRFKTTKMGHRVATSVGGAITGTGGDYLIADDLIKPDESLSDTIRRKTNAWFDQTFLARFNNRKKGKAVMVMQRVHEDDPTGHIMEQGHWHQLILPAYYEKKTVIDLGGLSWKMDEGSYLHEERLGEEELDMALSEMGMYAFVGQYLQRPSPDGGGEFKAEYIQYYDNYSKQFSCEGMNIYILYDPANEKKNKERTDPDYTAIVVVGLANDNNYYVLDLVRDRFNPTERIDELVRIHKKWNKKSGRPPKVACEQYGMMTDSFYLKKRQEEINYRFKVVEVGGQVKKEDRIRRLIPEFEKERVFLPKKIIYDSIDGNTYDLVKVLVEEELMVFPVGKHDDMIDAFARVVDTNSKLKPTFPKEDVLYLEAGQSRKDLLEGNYRQDDFMTW